MARRQYPGGVSPFPTQHRPSIFNRLPPEEFLERRGEPVLWFRAMPVPPKSRRAGTLLTPDASSDNKGYILGFQKTFRILEETLAIQYHNNMSFQPAFSPIEKVHSAFIYRNELQGGNIPLEIDGIQRDSFTIKPVKNLSYWHEIRLDYEVLLFESRQFEFVKENDSPIIELREHPELITDVSGERLINVCVAINSVHKLESDGQKTEISPVEHDFRRLYLPETETGQARYLLDLNIYNPIGIAYSTLRAQNDKETTVPLHTGDLEAVISPYYPISEGDLIIMSRAQSSAKEISQRQNDGRFYLKYGPLVNIDKAYASTRSGSKEIEPETIQIDGFHSFRMEDQNVSSLSVSYSYHPQYRVRERLDFSALEERRQPVKWRLSPEHSNLVFAG